MMVNDKAMRGWLSDPPPPTPRPYIPGEEHKWYKMMGATDLLPEREQEAIRQTQLANHPQRSGTFS
jgi:hypothetical protein